jgi:transposase InsO family protein
MDFFVVPTVAFRLLYVLVILHHDRRMLHVNVTEHPTSAWVCQQLREGFSDEPLAKYLLLDHDSIFSKEVLATASVMGLKAVRTGFQSPWLNGVCERWVGNARRELLDHVIVFNEKHLRRLLREFVAYYNRERTSLAVDKDAPVHRSVTPRPSPTAKVIALPRLGGLHHRYLWRDAA